MKRKELESWLSNGERLLEDIERAFTDADVIGNENHETVMGYLNRHMFHVDKVRRDHENKGAGYGYRSHLITEVDHLVHKISEKGKKPDSAAVLKAMHASDTVRNLLALSKNENAELGEAALAQDRISKSRVPQPADPRDRQGRLEFFKYEIFSKVSRWIEYTDPESGLYVRVGYENANDRNRLMSIDNHYQKAAAYKDKQKEELAKAKAEEAAEEIFKPLVNKEGDLSSMELWKKKLADDAKRARRSTS